MGSWGKVLDSLPSPHACVDVSGKPPQHLVAPGKAGICALIPGIERNRRLGEPDSGLPVFTLQRRIGVTKRLGSPQRGFAAGQLVAMAPRTGTSNSQGPRDPGSHSEISRTGAFWSELLVQATTNQSMPPGSSQHSPSDRRASHCKMMLQETSPQHELRIMRLSSYSAERIHPSAAVDVAFRRCGTRLNQIVGHACAIRFAGASAAVFGSRYAGGGFHAAKEETQEMRRGVAGVSTAGNSRCFLPYGKRSMNAEYRRERRAAGAAGVAGSCRLMNCDLLPRTDLGVTRFGTSEAAAVGAKCLFAGGDRMRGKQRVDLKNCGKIAIPGES